MTQSYGSPLQESTLFHTITHSQNSARIFPFFFAVLSPKISRAKALVRFSRCRAPRGRLSRKIGSKQIAIGWWTASQACERCEFEGNFQVEGHSNCTLGKCHNSF